MFDYIVAGAGTAGCTLAARLSEDPAAHVLLIEAGPADRRREVHIPAAFPELLGSELDWKDITEPQPELCGRRIFWPRGRVLGGSGSIGAMIHIPGCRADYDAWCCAGWRYDDLRPLLRELSMGTPEPGALSSAFLDACESCGLPRREGTLGPEQEGAAMYPLAAKNHARWSAADAFLRPALRRGNLTVWTGIQVTSVLTESGRATGVAYLQRGSPFQVSASREVILCAGAVGSPRLLLLSGIGPQTDLEALKIPLAADVPGVGANLQDHLAAELSYWCTQPVSLAGSATRLNILSYIARKSGPLVSNLLEAGAYAKSCPDLPACDLEILFVPLGSLETGLKPPAEHGFSFFAALLTPRSRGRISLTSDDPMAPPRIDPEYASAPEDRAALDAASQLARRIASTESFAPYRGPSAAGGWQETARSLYHPGGTCRMGQDASSVVDPELKVHGIAGLRIADASIMPVIPRAHPSATVTIIAEKAARLILGN